jgi:hypothetical protein
MGQEAMVFYSVGSRKEGLMGMGFMDSLSLRHYEALGTTPTKNTESSHFQLQARSEMSKNPEKADPSMFSLIDVGPRAHRN